LPGSGVVPWAAWRIDPAVNVRDGADAPCEPLLINPPTPHRYSLKRGPASHGARPPRLQKRNIYGADLSGE
jgi:hypothetical protein